MEHFQTGLVITFAIDVDVENYDEAKEAIQLITEQVLIRAQEVEGANSRVTKVINPYDLLRIEDDVNKL